MAATTFQPQTPNPASTLQDALAAVPQPIRHWFGSERVTYLMVDINRKFNITDDRRSIIPRLILRLEVQDLEPQRFADELQNELSLSKESAVSFTRELDEKLFRPIKKELFEWGVDIDLLDFGKGLGEIARSVSETEAPPPAAETQPRELPVPIRKEEMKPRAEGLVPVPLETLRIAPEPAQAKIHPFALGEMPRAATPPPTPTPPSPPRAATPPPTTPQPFMLHQEEKLVPIMESKPVMIQRASGSVSAPSKPTAVRLEISGSEEQKKEQLPVKTEVPTQRVVHYSTFRTPLSPFGAEVPKEMSAGVTPAPPAGGPKPAEPMPYIKPPLQEEVIDLSTFKRAPAQQKPPAVIRQLAPTVPSGLAEKPPAAQPKLEGNTVDLRGNSR